MESQVDYSDNLNNINNFYANNSRSIINQNRLFNQMTDIYTDSCEYKQRLDLASKPLKYFVNSLNTIEGVNENDKFMTFTPIGNAALSNIPNFYERPIPSTLQTTSSIYTLPYSTSPFLGSSNNINTLDTDNDLTLKTGLSLRSKNNKAELSSKKHPVYGDIHAHSIGATVQNAGQYYPSSLSNVVNSQIPGLNQMPSNISEGIGINQLGGVNGFGISTTNLYKNYLQGPYKLD